MGEFSRELTSEGQNIPTGLMKGGIEIKRNFFTSIRQKFKEFSLDKLESLNKTLEVLFAVTTIGFVIIIGITPHELVGYLHIVGAILSFMSFLLLQIWKNQAGILKKLEKEVDKIFDKLVQMQQSLLDNLAAGIYRVLATKGQIGLEVSDEVLYYLLIEEFVRSNLTKIEKVKMSLLFHDSGFTPVFLQRLQVQQRDILRASRKEPAIEKRFRLIDNTEYDRETFEKVTPNPEAMLLWLHQIQYSKIFFYEDLPKEKISVFHLHSNKENAKTLYPTLREEQNKDGMIQRKDLYGNSEIVSIEADKLYFCSIAQRDLATFSFVKAKIYLFDDRMKVGQVPYDDIQDYFDFLSRKQDAHWNGTPTEYALLSAENIKHTTRNADVVFAVDDYDDTGGISSWIKPPLPRWIVWRACQVAFEKCRDENKKPLLTIKRLFVVDDNLVSDPSRMNVYLSVLAMQLYLGVSIRMLTKSEYAKWYNVTKKAGKCPIPSTLDASEKFPDYAFVKRTLDKDDLVIKGVNATVLKAGSGTHKHGPIFEGENDWLPFSNLLWESGKIPKQLDSIKEHAHTVDLKSCLKEVKNFVPVDAVIESFRSYFQDP